MIRSRETHTVADEAPLDPAIAAELDALEAALRGDAIEDDGLAALVRDVQAQAPVMPSEFRADLRADVAAGFPRFGRRRRREVSGGVARPRTGRRRKLLYGGGAGALLAMGVFAVVLVGSNLNGSDDSSSTVSDVSPVVPAMATPSDTRDSAASAASGPGSGSRSGRFSTDQADENRPGTADSQVGSAGSGGLTDQQQALVDKTLQSTSAPLNKLKPAADSSPATGTRRVERSVDLAVRVKSGKLDDASGQVAGIVRHAGGYLADSSVSLRTRGAGAATYTLKIATAKLDRAVDQLSALGTVTRQQQESQDITSSFDSVQSRLDDANGVRAALLRALAKADTNGEIASLRSRIADNRKTRASLDAQLGRLRQRTNLTTVALTLRAPTGDAASAAEDDGQWSISDAAGDALHILGVVAGGLLVAAGALLPFAIIGGLAFAVYRVRRRRSREAALDG